MIDWVNELVPEDWKNIPDPPAKGGNPIVCNDVGEWFFYNEYWLLVYGPYDSKELAQKMLKEYCKNI